MQGTPTKKELSKREKKLREICKWCWTGEREIDKNIQTVNNWK